MSIQPRLGNQFESRVNCQSRRVAISSFRDHNFRRWIILILNVDRWISPRDMFISLFFSVPIPSFALRSHMHTFSRRVSSCRDHQQSTLSNTRMACNGGEVREGAGCRRMARWQRGWPGEIREKCVCRAILAARGWARSILSVWK